jgi:hypothetical protein
LPEIAQRLPRRHKLEASDGNVRKRQKQAHYHEKPNEWHFKRDSAALIRDERPLDHKPTSTGVTEGI